MKVTSDEIFKIYNESENAQNATYDEDGRLTGFEFIRYYNGIKSGGRRIKVSLKSESETKRKAAIYLPEKDFFEKLADNYKDVENVKINGEKIYKYSLNGEKYKTDKSDTKKLFDFMPYADFKKITNQRFYRRDDILRNGYFSGLVGTNDDNIQKYNKKRNDYDLYDVDFNSAYPYCFKMPLPCGRFFTPSEWESAKSEYKTFIKFYQIQVKTIVNTFDKFVPPAPYVEYADFDFLLQKNSPHMVVSEYRLGLIYQVYGRAAVVIKKEYFCPTKIYVKLSKFAQQLYIDIQDAKKKNDFLKASELKIALNSLVGNFGKRDESKKIQGIEKIDSGIFAETLMLRWSEPEYKENANYIPLAMAINDITSRRLLNLMTEPNVMRLCYNTDGGIIAIKKGYRIVTSEKIGRLKAKPIIDPVFLSTSMLYCRPLILDGATGIVFNSKAINYDKRQDTFFYSEVQKINCRAGFFSYDYRFPVVVEPYSGTNLRKSEILLRVNNSAAHKILLRDPNDIFNQAVYGDIATELDKLCHPHNPLINEIRHAPRVPEHIEFLQLNFLNENFVKKQLTAK